MIASFFITVALAIASPADIIPAPVSFREMPGSCASDAPVKYRLGKKMEKGAYKIVIDRRRITVDAADSLGAFYAAQTLRQLRMHSDKLACCVIEDAPRFAYRGYMLDLVSTWHDADYIKRQIDAMALCKMNVLHLHLSDTHAWRLESEKFPLLHQTTSWRYGASGEDWKVNRLFAPVAAPGAVGGFYTKEQMRDIICYAAERHIEIIPEIDFPGHVFAALSAYPELRCESYVEEQGDPNQPPYLVELCIGNPRTFDFVYGILDEVAELFPSDYLHIGGDEAKMTAWKTCGKCQALMHREGMKDVSELQQYFTRKVTEYLVGKGKRPVGWDEYAQAALPEEAVVMKWHTKCELPAGNDVIMATHNYTYLCYYQDAPMFERPAWSRYLPLDAVYGWDPAQESGAPSRILGIESCQWTSHLPDDAYLDYMTWPRLAAIAERAWSPESTRDYNNFKERLRKFYPVLDSLGINYFDIDKEVGHRPESLSGVNHLALNCPVQSTSAISASYSQGGLPALTDGICGDWNGDDHRWIGFSEAMDVTVDLGEVKPLRYVGASFLCHKGYSRDLPKEVRVSFSSDGISWSEEIVRVCEISLWGVQCAYPELGINTDCEARYVRYRASRREGPVKWPLLVDELIVL
ncbi:MAG: family 20 glycosylhydrolase [Bacteroidales bacterium]|nr:family 20 glycosylhydrolase [Bacteroidales bacterium]